MATAFGDAPSTRQSSLRDVNRDGQAAILRISGSTVHYYLNTGRETFTSARGDYPGLPATYQTQRQLFADMNGNGTADIVWVTQDYELRYVDLLAEPHFGLLTRVDNGMGEVATISYRTSTEFMIDAKRAGAPWKTPMASPMPVVSRITVSDSFDKLGLTENRAETRFTYRDGYYDGKEREFRGFAHVVTELLGDDASGNPDPDYPTQVTETWLHVGRNLTTGEDEEILKGKQHSQLTRDRAGNVYQSVETVWERSWLCQELDLPPGSPRLLPVCADFGSSDRWQAHKDELVAFAQQRAALTGTWEATEAPRYTYATTDEVDAWGNVLRATAYGEVTFPLPRQVGDPFALADMEELAGNDEIVSLATYINDIDEWLLRLSRTSRIEDLSGNVLTQEEVYYDGPICDSFPCDEAAFQGLDLGVVTHGRVVRRLAWLHYPGEPERWVAVERTAYNRAGQPVATRDANDSERRLSYDPETGGFLVEESIAVDDGGGGTRWYSMTAEYDRGFGVIERSVDFNGERSEFEFDGLARVTSIIDPLSSEAEPTHTFSYTYGTADNPVSFADARALVERGTGVYHTTRIFFDGLARERQRKYEAEAPHAFVASGWEELSPRGRPIAVYDPFVSADLGIEAPPSDTPVTRTSFDVLNREVRVRPPVTDFGTTFTRTVYLPWETRTFDERDTHEGILGFPAVARVDGLGRVVDIVKWNEIEGVPTELRWTADYDLLGNITRIEDPQQNSRVYSYDSLARLRYIVDPNAGALEYAYDDVGNMISRIDALGQRIDWEYGQANRLLAQHMSLSASLLDDFSYTLHYDVPDTAADALLPGAQLLAGRVSRIVSPMSEATFSNDALGRAVSTAQRLRDPDVAGNEDVYYAHTTYDPQGKVLTESLPGGMLYLSAYNRRQLLSSFDATLPSGGTYGGEFAYDASGLPVRSDYDNGLSTCRFYDRRQRLRAVRTVPTDELGAWIEPAAGCSAPDEAQPNDIVYRRYDHTRTGLISDIRDLSPERPELPRLAGSYDYDRLYQLVSATSNPGTSDANTIGYAYDTVQNLLRRTVTDPSKGPPAGALVYSGAGPNQVTSAFGKSYAYDAGGFMQAHNGYNLVWDVEGRLVEASKADGTRLRWFYDFAGERRLKISELPGEPQRIYRYPFPSYRERDGEPTWILVAGSSVLGEVAIKPQPVPDLVLLDGLIAHGHDPSSGLSPLPWQLDQTDLRGALERFWTGLPAGTPVEVGTYYHRDHLDGPAHVTDSQGELVATTAWHPYGSEAVSRGLPPSHTFAGAEREPERELGLIQMGVRWYAPGLCRWTSADPLVLQDPRAAVESTLEASLYVYGLNGPIVFVDPFGLAVAIPVGQRQNVKGYDVPGKVYTIYRFEVYDYDTFEEYEAAQAIGLVFVPIADFELAGAAQMRGGTTALELAERTAEVRLLQNANEFMHRKGKYALGVFDVGKKHLKYSGPKKICGKSGRCNAAGVRIHGGGPKWSLACLTSPDPRYKPRGGNTTESFSFVNDRGKTQSFWQPKPELLEFEAMIRGALALENIGDTAQIRLPGRGVDYPEYSAGFDFGGMSLESFLDWDFDFTIE